MVKFVWGGGKNENLVADNATNRTKYGICTTTGP
jgi:hypothetical protein